jgi:hypothetical protein
MSTTIRLVLLCCVVTTSQGLSREVVVAQNRCAGIGGRVTSIQGWLIPAATIRFINKATRQSSTVETDDNGEYSACLAPGSYDVVPTANGYKAAKRKSIKVEAEGQNAVGFVMKPNGKVDSVHP